MINIDRINKSPNIDDSRRTRRKNIASFSNHITLLKHAEFLGSVGGRKNKKLSEAEKKEQERIRRINKEGIQVQIVIEGIPMLVYQRDIPKGYHGPITQLTLVK